MVDYCLLHFKRRIGTLPIVANESDTAYVWDMTDPYRQCYDTHMKKTLFILLLLIAGVGLWFYLLLGRDPREKETEADQTSQTAVVEEKSVQTSPQQNIPATTSDTLPPQTDYGMEFPVLEE